jgi:hypothetical protein
MKAPPYHTIYNLEKLISGDVIGEEGMFAAVPERGYRGHPFTIKHFYTTMENGELKYRCLEVEVKDWNSAVAFRKHPQTIPGLGKWYTLGYFRMPKKDL